MSMIDQSHPGGDADPQAVALKVYELRTALGMTQKELADAVGVTASRISQLELRPGKAKESAADLRMPPKGMLFLLANVLGDDILRAARFGAFAEPSDMQQDAMVALWRIRIDVLRSPSVVKGPKESAARAAQLADELEAAACRAPESRVHSRNGQLDSLRRITAELPDGAKMLLAAEALGMVIDAPMHVLRVNARVRAREAVVGFFRTIGLDAENAKNVLERDAPRDLWDWKDRRPQCAGGAVGQLQALRSGGASALLLKGFDPSGWMGWPMIAGAWQVRRPAADGSSGDRSPQAGPAPGESVHQGLRVPQEFIADDVVRRFDRGTGPAPSMGWLAECDADVRPRLLTAVALGRDWVRQHANRLVALYNGFPAAEGDDIVGLPWKVDAIHAVSQLRDAAGEIYKWEKERSGADSDQRPRLRAEPFDVVLQDWDDMRRTWEYTVKKLSD
jgi:transcriptional regulator with XRE-family HTH domain